MLMRLKVQDLKIINWGTETYIIMIAKNAKQHYHKGGNPGLVVIGRYSRSKGCGFESRHRKLDGHF